MPKINLRAYLAYIEERLSRGAYDEVSTQCRHILSVYPRYIDVYRLFARALLEQGQYQDALDLFLRVLSADPCDFVAHIGVSDCYEQLGALDQAIWHLERAFEQASNNADLKHEIKQLYEARDGVAPGKLQLSAGAQARLYVDGGLYEKAIAELRTALNRDPERLDLSLLLADALWHNQEQVAAGRLAAEIHKRLPNSIEANRLLARQWLEAGKPDEAAPFLARLKDLDPYLGYEVECDEPARGSVAEIEMLVKPNGQHSTPAGAVEWLAQHQPVEKEAVVTTAPLPAMAVAQQDAAAESTGGPSAPPDWLREALGSTSSADSEVGDGASAAIPETIEPGQYFRDKQPVTSTGGVENRMTDFTDDAGKDPQENETPDWLQDVLGEDSAAPAGEPDIELGPADNEPPAWLEDTLARPAASAQDAAAAGDTDDESLPGWLSEALGESSPGEDAGSPPGQEATVISRSGKREAPGWLAGILKGEEPEKAEEPEKPAEPDVVSDDWLDELLTSDEAAPASSAPAEGTPGWLREINDKPTESPPPPTDLADMGDVETWDESLKSDAQAGSGHSDSYGWTTPPASTRTEPDELEPTAPLPSEPEDDVSELPSAGSTGEAAEAAEAPEEPPAEEPSGRSGGRLAGLLAGVGAAPKASDDTPGDEAGALEDSGAPDWNEAAEEVLSDDAPAMDDLPAAPEPLQVPEEDTLPDWLNNVGPVEDPPEAVDEPTGSPVSDDPPNHDNPGNPTAAADNDGADGMRRDEDVSPLDSAQPNNGESEEIPDWLAEGDLDSDEAIEWLEELAAKYDPGFEPTAKSAGPEPAGEAASPAAEVAGESTRAPVDELPGWLAASAAKSEAEPATATAAAEAPPEAEAAEPTTVTAAAETPPEAEAAEDAMGWLDEQVAEQGVDAEEGVSEALTVDFPPTAPPAAEAEGEAVPAEDEELPEWLREPEAKDEIERAIESSPEDYEDSLQGVGDLEIGDDELAWLDSALESDEVDMDADELEAIFSEANGEAAKVEPAAEVEAEEAAAEAEEVEAPAEAAPAPAAASDQALPEWLLDTDQLAWSDEAEEVIAEVEEEEGELPEWLQGEAEATVEGTEPEAEAEEAAADGWLAAPAAKPTAGLSEGVDVTVTGPGSEEPTELPAWLQGDIDEEEEPEMEAEAAEAEAEEAAEPVAEEEAPEEHAEPVAEAEEEMVEAEAEAEAVAEAEEEAPVTEAEAAAEEEAAPVAEVEAEKEEAEEAAEPAAEAEAELAAESAVIAVAEPAPEDADDYDRLRIAREKLSPGTIGEAVPYYERLIGGGERLDETVADLNYYLRSEAQPDPRVRRLLGDALHAQGKLQEALDAYRGALDTL